MLEEYRTQRPHSVVREFLEINISELKSILKDVEQCADECEEFTNYEKLDGDE